MSFFTISKKRLIIYGKGLFIELLHYWGIEVFVKLLYLTISSFRLVKKFYLINVSFLL